jgi:hypothetical protein
VSSVRPPELWQVRIALNHDEWNAIRRAMFIVMPSERWTVLLAPNEDEDGESATLLIDVPAGSHTDAEKEAANVYAAARREAGFTEQVPLTILRPHSDLRPGAVPASTRGGPSSQRGWA